MPRAKSADAAKRPHNLSEVPRAQRLSDRVTDQLAQAIGEGKYLVGSRLPSERELCEQLSVSRTVVREAVRSLAALGLITVTAGRGVEVARASAQRGSDLRLALRGYGEIDYRTVHQVRMPLEIEAVGLAALNAKAEDVVELHRLCSSHAAFIDAGKHKDAGKADYAFHETIARLSGNPLIVAIYSALGEVLENVRKVAVYDRAVARTGLEAHRRLLEYIAVKDVEGARAAMRDHLLEAERQWKNAKS